MDDHTEYSEEEETSDMDETIEDDKIVEDDTDILDRMRVKVNQIKMVKMRGYNINKEENDLLDQDEEDSTYFKDIFPTVSDLTQIYTHQDPKRGTLFVFYLFIFKEREVGGEEIIPYIDQLEKSGCIESILITDRPISQQPLERLNTMTELHLASLKDKQSTLHLKAERLPFFIQHFRFSDLSYNPMEHISVPKHRILPPDERSALLKKITLGKLPNIKYADPISHYLGAKPGQIIEITRTSIIQNSAVGQYISYSSITF